MNIATTREVETTPVFLMFYHFSNDDRIYGQKLK